jgi:hypothetical protein
MLTDFSLRYITQRKERLRERKIQMSISPYTSTIHKHHTVYSFTVKSVEALLEVDPNEF